MSRHVIHGAWYGDHLPSGEFCALVPHVNVITHLGVIELPVGEVFGPAFVRCTNVGRFRFAGQAHDTLDPACWEYDGRWVAYPPPCAGVSPVIYDNTGVLHRSDGSVGSQGYRYVNPQNQIISGDATYRIDLGGGRFLFEYTDLGGLLIGQAAYDGGGVQVWDGSTLRQLELGDCRFVRANRAGEVVGLAFTRPEGVVLIQTTMAELRALSPVVSTPAPSPVPTPVPVPVPPRPEIPMSYVPQAPDITPMLRALTLEFPVEWAEAYEYDGHPRTNRFVRIAAARANKIDSRFGLNGKRGGDEESLDVLAFKNPTVPASCGGVELRDFIFDDGRPGAGRHEIVWSDATIVPGMRPDLPDGVKGKWIAPGAVPSGPAQPPADPVKPPVDTGELARVKADLAAAQAKIADLQTLLTAKPKHPDYGANQRMAIDLNAAFRAAQPRKEKDKRDLDPATYAHLLWRFNFEGYASDVLIADATARGKG